MELLPFAIFTLFAGSLSYGDKIGKKEDWGYVNVRQDAHMFWWLFYTNRPDYSRYPLIIWLQGGPGASGTGIGNFLEIGPLDINLKPRNSTWLQRANLLFLDSPVGTGFSYVTNQSALCHNNQQIADDLVTALKSILNTAPEFQKSPLYIFSESYGGKMAVDFSLTLSKAIKNKEMACNFKGVTLGDALISPLDTVSSWGDYLYATSYLDKPGLIAVKQASLNIKKSVAHQNFLQAFEQYISLKSLISNLTNNVDFHNILENVGPPSGKKFDLHEKKQQEPVQELSELMNGPIRQKLKNIPANVTWIFQSFDVFTPLREDFIKNVIPSVDLLLKDEMNIDVNIYTGQLDLVCNILGTLRWVERLKWAGLKDFLNAPKKPISFTPSNNAGFVKTFKNLSFFWILDAGHLVPADAPEAALKMLDIILSKKHRQTKTLP